MPTPGVSTQTPAEPEQEGRRWDNLSTWERSHLGGRKPPVLHPLPCPWDPGAPTSCYRREGQGDRGQGGAFPPGAACFGVPPCSVHTPRPCSRSASSKYSSGFPPAASPPPMEHHPHPTGPPRRPSAAPQNPMGAPCSAGHKAAPRQHLFAPNPSPPAPRDAQRLCVGSALSRRRRWAAGSRSCPCHGSLRACGKPRREPGCPYGIKASSMS